MTAEVRIEPYGPGDFELLVRANTPEMTEHLGGPESSAKLADRHQRYLVGNEADHMFRIEVGGVPAGIVGYWERDWLDERIFESGWNVQPRFQGHGVASAAVRLVQREATGWGRRWLHAFPSVDHPASNGVCRKSGFVLMGEYDFEYPLGHPMRCNDWRFDLQLVSAPMSR